MVPTINTAKAILTGITGDLILNNVNAPINFTTTINLTVSDVTGAINLGNNAGILNVANSSTITDTIDGSGTINFGAGTEVTDAVGSNNAITLVNFNAGGNVTLDSTSKATNFSIGNNTSVIAGDLMTGAVNFAAGAGTLVLQNGLNGAITTSVANTGILTINGGNVSGTIGATGVLNLINIGANPVTFGANVNSTNVALTNNNSSLTVGSNVVLTSAVTTANPNNGVLNLAPNSSVVGNIGTNAAAIAAVNVGAGPARPCRECLCWCSCFN
ncbi:cell surface antigen-like Sca13 domain protein [Rickettsia hoogstraalii str. RCCE3]|nr:cell surface antigen-like Sca13 domain protein [Rickettsia hoogstraalii str. RCCE3]